MPAGVVTVDDDSKSKADDLLSTADVSFPGYGILRCPSTGI